MTSLIVFGLLAQCDLSSWYARLPQWPATDSVLTLADALNDSLDPFCGLTDEFDDPATLSQWHRLWELEEWPGDQLELWDIDITRPGHMTMMPYTSSWFDDLKGVLVFKNVEGDFVATTRFNATNRAGTWAPDELFSLGGIFIRTPREITAATWVPGGENYIFLSGGAAGNPGFFEYEVKTTVNSDSTLVYTFQCPLEVNNHCPSIPDIELRGARLENEHFILMRRDAGEWVVHMRYHRDDMPTTLQVGFTTYTDWQTVDDDYYPEDQYGHNNTVITDGNPDLLAQYDYMRYVPPNIPIEHQGKNFSADYNPGDPTTISDEDLLSFLGF